MDSLLNVNVDTGVERREGCLWVSGGYLLVLLVTLLLQHQRPLPLVVHGVLQQLVVPQHGVHTPLQLHLPLWQQGYLEEEEEKAFFGSEHRREAEGFRCGPSSVMRSLKSGLKAIFFRAKLFERICGWDQASFTLDFLLFTIFQTLAASPNWGCTYLPGSTGSTGSTVVGQPRIHPGHVTSHPVSLIS